MPRFTQISRAVAVLALLFTSNLHGMIQGGFQAGVRSADEQQNVQSIHVLVDPLPLLPLAAGIRASTLPQNGTETSLQIHGWVPMIPMVTPFAFADIVLSSKNDVGESSGSSIGFGIERSMLPFISATLSIESGSRRLTPSAAGATESKSSYLALLIGLQAGI